jgi:alkylated DNA nucleotide flippase Atl1
MTITLTFEATTLAELDAHIRDYLDAHGGSGALNPLALPASNNARDTSLTNDDYRRAIMAIPAGRVAAYSVVSEVVRGDTRGSQKVAGLAANDATLGTAYRVVKIDRGIAAGFRWTDGRMGGADDARQLLEAEGVKFDVHGKVRSEFMLTAEQLGELYSREVG